MTCATPVKQPVKNSFHTCGPHLWRSFTAAAPAPLKGADACVTL